MLKNCRSGFQLYLHNYINYNQVMVLINEVNGWLIFNLVSDLFLKPNK